MKNAYQKFLLGVFDEKNYKLDNNDMSEDLKDLKWNKTMELGIDRWIKSNRLS